MSDVFIVDLFIFKSTKILPFTASNQTSYRYARIYQTHDIEYYAYFTYTKNNNLHPFSIFYNISILISTFLCK